MAGSGTDEPPRPWPDKERLDECRRCPLWEHATQGVPGEGGRHAAILLVGEQPGDEEDLIGRPFVGPAGKLLRSLLTAGAAAHTGSSAPDCSATM